MGRTCCKMCKYPPAIKHGNIENHWLQMILRLKTPFIQDFPSFLHLRRWNSTVTVYSTEQGTKPSWTVTKDSASWGFPWCSHRSWVAQLGPSYGCDGCDDCFSQGRPVNSMPSYSRMNRNQYPPSLVEPWNGPRTLNGFSMWKSSGSSLPKCCNIYAFKC